MVGRLQLADSIHQYRLRKGPKVTGNMDCGKPYTKIRFTPLLFQQIIDEAARRQISFNAMVIHLCEASIDGIE